MKKLLIVSLIMLSALSFYAINHYLQNNIAEVNTSQTIRKNTVKQKIGGGNYAVYKIEDEKTALDLLRLTSKVVTKGEKENAYVIEINRRKADEKKKEFWSFSINNTMAPVGAGSYVLKNNDKIEWKIETY